MKNIDLKRTFNLHKYSVVMQKLLSEWKNILPILPALSGIIFGTFLMKGEGEFYSKIAYLVEEILLNDVNRTITVNLIIHLMIPTCFAVILFFCGLSVYGGFFAILIPFIFSLMTGTIAFYMYSEYTLKGLAYCVIMLFPYVTLSLFSLMLITAECIKMSQYILYTLSNKRRKMPDYSINKYYINSIKSYSIIIVAAIIKTGIEYLFVGLFRF